MGRSLQSELHQFSTPRVLEALVPKSTAIRENLGYGHFSKWKLSCYWKTSKEIDLLDLWLPYLLNDMTALCLCCPIQKPQVGTEHLKGASPELGHPARHVK